MNHFLLLFTPLLLFFLSLHCNYLNPFSGFKTDVFNSPNENIPLQNAEKLDACPLHIEFEIEASSQKTFEIIPSENCPFLLIDCRSNKSLNVYITDSFHKVISFENYLKKNILIDISKLSPGNFFLTIRNTCQSPNFYALNSGKDSLEPDNLMDSANLIYCNAQPVYSFLTERDIDYFKFQAEKDSCYIFTITSALNANFNISNSDTTLLSLKSMSDSAQFYWRCPASGEHYCRLSQNSQSNQETLHYSISIQSFNDSYEPDNSIENATELLIGNTQSHHLFSGDVDWYKFRCRKYVPYALCISPCQSIPIKFTFGGETYFTPYSLSDSTFFSQVYGDTALYIKVGSDSLKSTFSNFYSNFQSYTINLTEVNDDQYEPNNTRLDARNYVSEGQTISGKIHTNDPDFYFLNTKEGSSYKINGKGMHNYRMMVFKPSGDTVRGSFLDSSIVFQCAESGTYSIGIFPNSYSSFFISGSTPMSDYFISMSTIINDTYEPDDSYLQAKAIATNGIPQTRIFVDGESDFIKFKMEKDTSYLFQSKNICYGLIYILKDTLQWISNPFSCGTSAKDSISFYWTCTKTDTYYICVRQTYRPSQQPQSYSLAIKSFQNDVFEFNDVPSLSRNPNNLDSTPLLKIIPNDVDWIKFYALPGVLYKIYTSHSYGYGSNQLRNHYQLFSLDGLTPLSQIKSAVDTIQWMCPSEGNYLVKLRFDSLDTYFTRTAFSSDYKIHFKQLTEVNYSEEIIKKTALSATLNETTTFELEPGVQKWVSFNAMQGTSYQFLNTAGKNLNPVLFSSEISTPVVSVSSYQWYSQSGFTLDCKADETFYIKYTHTDTSVLHVSLLISTYIKDSNEPDSTHQLSTNISTEGVSQNHTLGIGDGYDYFHFEGIAGKTYHIEIIGKDVAMGLSIPNNSTAKYTGANRGYTEAGAYFYLSCTNSGLFYPVISKKNIDPNRVSYSIKVYQ